MERLFFNVSWINCIFPLFIVPNNLNISNCKKYCFLALSLSDPCSSLFHASTIYSQHSKRIILGILHSFKMSIFHQTTSSNGMERRPLHTFPLTIFSVNHSLLFPDSLISYLLASCAIHNIPWASPREKKILPQTTHQQWHGTPLAPCPSTCPPIYPHPPLSRFIHLLSARLLHAVQ